MKSYFRTLSLVLAATVAGMVAAAVEPATAPRPNFVFIIGDDISADDLGCYGNPGIRTPNIDRLAAESRVFDNAYVSASSCSPSRCSIITSRYPHNLETAAELYRPLPAGVAIELGEVSYHLGWTFHRAGPNKSEHPRRVMTMIYIDEDIRLIKSKKKAHETDRLAFCPEAEVGGILNGPLTPVIWSRGS